MTPPLAFTALALALVASSAAAAPYGAYPQQDPRYGPAPAYGAPARSSHPSFHVAPINTPRTIYAIEAPRPQYFTGYKPPKIQGIGDLERENDRRREREARRWRGY